MRNFKGICLSLLALVCSATACNKEQIVGDQGVGNPGTHENGGSQVAVLNSAAPEPVEKALVDGCNGSGTIVGAKQAFDNNDFKEANRQARCAFNDSVKADPNNPNTEAAFYAFLSSVALGVESPQFTYLADESIAANQVFGARADLDAVQAELRNRFGNEGGFALLGSFFKYHEQKGHAVRDVVDQAATFVNERLMDWNTLTKAMAMDLRFVSFKIPVGFLGNSSEQDFTYTEAAIFRAWINMARLASKLYAHYDLGITHADSFASLNTLVQDMNTAPKFLSLKTTGNGSDLVPYVQLALYSLNQAVADGALQPRADWLDLLGDLVPEEAPDRFSMVTTSTQLLDSLQNGMTFLSIFNLKVGLDLKKVLAALPDAAKVDVDVVKVEDDSIGLGDSFLKAFLKDAYVERPYRGGGGGRGWGHHFRFRSHPRSVPQVEPSSFEAAPATPALGTAE